MTTSLARQLAALRTPATSALETTSYYSGPFLFEEADQTNCDFATLKEKMKNSMEQLIDNVPELNRFYDFLVFKRDGDKLEKECIEELLFLLSPYMLLKPAQWVLQFMVIEHKVHYKYPELFFFCVLPFYEYDIYAKCLLAIDTIPGGTNYPNWLIKFKVNCAPTTKLALYRHTASDKGFLKLLTDTMIKLMRMTVEYPYMRIERQTSMFTMTVLGGLENKDKITEDQTLYVLQVIFKAMKSNHTELIAMSQILLSYILPKMAFKEKVVAKILKSLKNCVKKKPTMECLMVLIMIVRTQQSLDLETVWPVIISLESVINGALNETDDVEMVHNLDDILYTLALLIQPAVPKGKKSKLTSFPAVVNRMLGVSSHIISSVKISSETVGFIGETVYNLLRSMRNTVDADIVDVEGVAKAKEHSQHIIKQINKLYPETYQLIAVDSDDIDLFFIGGSKGTGLSNKPDEALVMAQKVLLNNSLLNVIKEQLVPIEKGWSRMIKDAWKKNAGDIKAFLSVDTEFLVYSLPGSQFQNAMFNILNFSQDRDIKNLCVGHLCDQLVWRQDNKDIDMEVQDGDDTKGEKVYSDEKGVFKLRLEMALLPVFCQGDAATRKIVTNSFFAIHSDIIACLALISPAHPDKRDAVMDKIKPFMSSEVAKLLMEDSFLWADQRIMSLLLPFFKEKIIKNLVKVEKHDLIRFVAKLMLKFPNMKDEITEGLIVELLLFANVTTTVEDGVVIMECLPDLIEAKATKFVAAIENLIESSMEDEEKILRFYMGCGAITKCLKTKYLILCPVPNLLENNEFIEKLLEPSTNIFPMLLSLILNGDLQVRKLGFTIIKKLKTVSKGWAYDSIVQFLATNRNELTADLSSLTSLLKKADLNPEGSQCLLQSTTRCFPLITNTLMPFFSTVKSTEAVKDISAFGSDLIKSGINDDTVACIIKKFYKRIIKNIGEESCFNFFCDSLKCERIVILAGIKLRISDVMLDNVTAPKLWAGVGQDVLIRVLEGAVGQSSDSSNVKLISMLCMIKIPVELFITMFNKVWGENNLKSKKRGKSDFSDYNVGLDEAQLKIWGKTVFVLELLDSYLPTETCDDGWQTVVPTIFAVFRKLSNDDVMESSYKLNIILTVLLKLFNILPDARIKELKKGDLEAELLTYCIRRCSNPESRSLALKVLARCSITIPEYVLQNSMTIFTFMGTHLLKMDSKHSYQIACEAIDVIIPAMKSTSTSKQELKKISLEMLNNFIHMDEDVPEHRYSEFVFRLIKALDAETYLWIAMLLCIKSTFKSKNRVQKTSLIHRRLTELIQRFTLQEALRAIIGLFVNMQNDSPPLRKIFGCSMDRREDQDKADEWDVLRLGGLVLISKLVSSTDLVTRVGKELISNHAQIKDLLHLSLSSSFLTLECFTDLPESTPQKLKTSILDQGEKCLQQVLALLPYQLYISIVAELLASHNSTLRRRAMEVVISKLDSVDPDDNVSADCEMLLPALTQLCINETIPENQQIAFLSLRQISRLFKNGSPLMATLETLDTKFLDTLENPGVIGAAILTITDLLTTIGAQACPSLNDIVNWLIKSIKSIPDKKWEEKYEKVVYTSLLLAIQKIVEKFGGFLNPHVEKIVMVSCRLYSHPIAAPRAKELWNSLAQHLSPHVLMPIANEQLENIWEEPGTVAKLSGLVGLNNKKLDRGQLHSMENQIIQYFNKAFSYREEHSASDQVNAAESEVIEGFLSLAMKMCLDDFKPMFNKVVEKLKTGGDASYVTLFNFIERISNSLKNLFGFGLEFVLLEATTTLTKKNCSNLCAESVLRCLRKVVMYNKITELSQDVYENLVSAIFTLYQRDGSLHQFIQDALYGLADCTDNDVYWKHLNFCTLMELRNSETSVRIQILRVVKGYVTVKRDTYLVVLSDAVPFLTETLEDDDQDVENECRELIQHMETVFGQDIQDYFS